VHRKEPRGRPLSKDIEHGNRTRFRTGTRVEHPFAEQKDRMGLIIRTMAARVRAKGKIGNRNLAYKTFVWWQGRSVSRGAELAK